MSLSGVDSDGYGWKVARKKAKDVKRDELRDGSEEMMFLFINSTPTLLLHLLVVFAMK